MSECKCFHWSRVSDMSPTKPDTFSLPASLPDWPPGLGFASGRIHLGEIEVLRISQFEFIWSSNLLDDKKKGVSFYKPLGAPDGFHILGHYCHSNKQPLRGFLLLARQVASCESKASNTSPSVTSPALQRPLNYTLVWSSEDGSHGNFEGGFFWLPQPPEGYKAVGFLVTTRPERPDLDEVRCIRADLTDECQAYCLMLHAYSRLSDFPFQVWSIRPSHRGMLGRGVSVGTFFCSSYWTAEEPLNIACLRNIDSELHAMPNLEQIHSLINHYGPTVFFHPDETYLPSSVSWFFQNGALLYNAEDLIGQPIDANGSNLPGGGRNDGEFWIDLPRDERRDTVKCGNLETAKLYAHVKPAFGGTFTDIAMWVFCPFNGPATFKAGPVNISLGKIGQHVGDWEHFTLRICNFTGELWSIYFSQHSGGQWVEAYDLEYIEANKAIVYSSKNGHASYPHPGTYLQGPSKLGIGIRNDACRSNLYVNSSTSYEIVAAEYLGADIEPGWLLFMREWGPKIVYSSRTELDKIIKGLPLMLRYSVENIFKKFPLELYGEEGPTGPKEKNNWMGDERG
ncbi:hypothetical protein K2173_013700 [Erythroxylum novogranatense]|uniref:Vacuolar protein sorting-associated protein 62 n=1 Tax=Erythroxylum novogranatense TaxID=1862640 RepID=A0AAV8SAM5_9ROSI|nr:hypothetical protein K2173_013700 [Erythroxylum novogranatense]